MINDGFDIFCLMKIGEQQQKETEPDDVVCACEDYFLSENIITKNNNSHKELPL